MFIKFLFIILAGYIIYSLATMKKRMQELKQIQFDASVVASAVNIVSTVKDLKGDYVKTLRDGGEVVLVFGKDSVYVESKEDSSSKQCLLNRLQNGENPLCDKDNKAFAELVYNSLRKVSWMCVAL